MKSKFALVFILLIGLTVQAQSPNWLWAKQAGAASNDEASSIAVDLAGNSYVTGGFSSSTVSFGSSVLTNTGSGNIFLAKYDAAGNPRWAKSATGSGIDWSNCVVTDKVGNVYIAGIFSSPTMTLDTITLKCLGSYDAFVAKYDTAGNVLWARKAGDTGDDEGYSVAVDGLGNVYITGYFDSPFIKFGSFTLTNTSSNDDVFVVKYDASGTVQWAKKEGGTSFEEGYSVSTDASNNVYVGGYFSSTSITIGSYTLNNAGVGDVFLAKYDTQGNVQWAKSVGGTKGETPYCIATRPSGNTCITGIFYSPSITFGSTTLTNANNKGDMFVLEYNSSGNPVWAARAGGTGDDEGNGVAVDVSGNTFITGDFMSTSIAFGSNTFNNAGVGNSDIFVAKYDGAGNLIWAKNAGKTGDDLPNSVAVDNTGNSYITGFFDSSSLTFGSNNINNAGSSYNIFLAKIDAITGIRNNHETAEFKVYPNPSQGLFTIELNVNDTRLEVCNVLGEVIRRSQLSYSKAVIDLSDQSKGTYFCRVLSESGSILANVKLFVQ